MPSLLHRSNQIRPRAEHWRPPRFSESETVAQRAVAALRRFLDLQAGSIWRDLRAELATVHGTLLDVGCGARPYRRLVPDGVRYLGIDTADAKEHFGYETPGTVYFSGDTWPVEDQSVDAILCTETLEHVLEPRRLLQEARRCLRPGGRLILTVPFAARWHYVPYDYWRFTPSSLAYLLAGAGFGEVAVYARGNPLSVACLKTMALLLPLLFPRPGRLWPRLLTRAAGLLTLPLLFLLALVGTLTLHGDWGEDCLGYTVTARRDGRD
jgi:SAM-dependent methyltransferase